MSVCDKLLQNDQPYQAVIADCVSNTPRFQACAHIVSRNPSQSTQLLPKQLYLPITIPSPGQIEKCITDALYCKNVLLNLAGVLCTACKASNTTVEVVSGEPMSGSVGDSTVVVDINLPPVALGDPNSCEELLFGEHRITSSPGFDLTEENGRTYAKAVCMYQVYNNVRIGSNITLVPVKPPVTATTGTGRRVSISGGFGKCTPMIVSMSCPELCVSQEDVGVSVVANNVKFGPNHATRIVEMMKNLAPFVRRCSELYMKLPTETVADINEDMCMPVPQTVAINHCFTHDASRGMSAYVATHCFSIPVGILNTYTQPIKESGAARFPSEKTLVIHIAVIVGGMPAKTGGYNRNSG